MMTGTIPVGVVTSVWLSRLMGTLLTLPQTEQVRELVEVTYTLAQVFSMLHDAFPSWQ